MAAMPAPKGDTVDVPIESGAIRAEYDRELAAWLRRRLGYLCIAIVIFQLISTGLLVAFAMGAVTSNPEPERAPTPIERRAMQAERRAEAGLAPRPGDERARAIAAEIQEREDRARQAERGREAVVSTLDILNTMVKDAAQGLTDGRRERRAAAPMRPMDRWYLDEPAATEIVTAADKPSFGSESNPIGGESASASAQADGQSTDQANAQIDGTGENAAQRGSRRTSSASLNGNPNDDSSNENDALSEEEEGDLDAAAPAVATVLPWWGFVGLSLPTFLVVGWFGLVVRRQLQTHAEFVAAASRMILILGLITFVFEAALIIAIPGVPATPLLSIFFWHATASLFLPWSWRESLKPIVPLLAGWLLLSLGLAVQQDAWLPLVLKVVAVPFIFAPALVLCYVRLQWHQSKFKTGFVGRRFLEMRREYQQARAVHESLFPKPFSTEWMRFDFGYRPAAEIGGDFIHAWIGEDERFYLTLIDVTGHGLASAMSVARIHGEIERLRDEHPDEGPAKLLARLNRYFHRLLARHRLYATGILLTIDPRTGELRYASAGHPPIFLRSKGDVTELASTTFMLGAVDNEVFGEDEVTLQLNERDTLILFTDGAYDAKNPRGERFGLEQLRETIARPVAPPKWTQFLMRLLDTYEAGVAEDDLLIAEITLLQRRSISHVTGDPLPLSRAYAEMGEES